MSRIVIRGAHQIVDPQLIIFDKDGTLIDIHHYWTSMIRLRAHYIVETLFSGRSDSPVIEQRLSDAMGVDLKSGKMKPEGPVGVKPRPFIVDVARHVVEGYGMVMTHEEMEAIFRVIDEQTAQNMAPLLKLLPGVLGLLEACRRCGIMVVVASTDIAERAFQAMQAAGIASYFEFVLGGDSVANSKPAPDLAILAMERVGAKPERTVVIGDHPVDIEMGDAAGIPHVVGVLTGLSSRDQFAAHACAVIDDLTEVEAQC